MNKREVDKKFVIGSQVAGRDIVKSKNKNNISMDEKEADKDSVIGSQTAGRDMIKSKNKNDISINEIRKETMLISFVVGLLASLLASYIFHIFFTS